MPDAELILVLDMGDVAGDLLIGGDSRRTNSRAIMTP